MAARADSLGSAERRVSQERFVMTKVDGRTKKEAGRQINQSLKRLGIDYIDLLNITSYSI